jgi:hypothetical protein
MGIDLGRFKQDLADQALEKRLQDNAVDKAVQKQKRKYSKKHDDAWVEWLSDEQPSVEVQQELREKRKERANRYVRRPTITTADQPSKAETTAQPVEGVSIHINIPEWHKPEFKRTKAAWIALRPHLTRNRVITISTTVAVLALLWGGLAVLKHQGDVRHARELADSSNGQPKVLSAQSKPTFTPAVPSGKEDLLTPDGTHSKFDASKGSYSYLDTLSGKQIIVSEQALPSADAAKTTAAKAAKSFNTDATIKTGWGTVYIQNAQSGGQRVVASVRELLVLVQTSYSLTNDQWKTYINSLQ